LAALNVSAWAKAKKGVLGFNFRRTYPVYSVNDFPSFICAFLKLSESVFSYFLQAITGVFSLRNPV
jgi:hypothetical protein